MTSPDADLAFQVITAHRRNYATRDEIIDGVAYRRCLEGCLVQVHPGSPDSTLDELFARHQARQLRSAGLYRAANPGRDERDAADTITGHRWRHCSTLEHGEWHYHCAGGCTITHQQGDPLIVDELFVRHQAELLTGAGFRTMRAADAVA